ncbi:hypothetical protein DLK05_06865 [Ancylomarina longa]|uniref:Uncharacterized protein n=1 Tax=Ancylomarina longa TaxID=2487017 RepID=A0A434AWH6_9BACT|nr:hypothetical protein DLK05_06865 [Ancylomarina longa]
MDSSLKKIINDLDMPLCVRKTIIKEFIPQKIYYVEVDHLQTSKHRFRTYPKPISKIISL